MAEAKSDFADRMSGHMSDQVKWNAKKKEDAKQVQDERRRGDLKGVGAVVAVLVGLGLCLVLWAGYSRTGSGVSVKFSDLRESKEGGRHFVSGRVKNTSSSPLKGKAYTVSYVDQDKKTVCEATLTLPDVPAGKSADWKVEMPRYREGATLVDPPTPAD